MLTLFEHRLGYKYLLLLHNCDTFLFQHDFFPYNIVFVGIMAFNSVYKDVRF